MRSAAETLGGFTKSYRTISSGVSSRYTSTTTLRTAVRGLTAFRRKGVIIRINFWTWRRRTPIASHWPTELPFIRSLGGTIDAESGMVIWTGDSARRFALFILLHEISHLMFKLSYPRAGVMSGGNPFEETWCDEKAKELLGRLQ